jgi:hypothetical protein
MTYVALAKLKKNSVPTTLSTGITAAATSIPVTDVTRFYDDSSTLITKGIIIGGDNANALLPEEITITGVSSTAGAGSLTGATRGVNADGTIGAAAIWPQGTNIGVTITAGVYNQIKDNFTECFQRDGSVAMTGPTIKRNVSNEYMQIYGDSAYPTSGIRVYGNTHTTTPGKIEFSTLNAAKSAWIPSFWVNGATDTPTPAFAGFKRGATSVADGGTITHGCGAAPVAVVCTASVSAEFVSVTTIGATTFTVAIKKHDGSAGTTAVVYWMAWL